MADPGIEAGAAAGKVLVRDSADVPDNLRKLIQGRLGDLVRDPESVRVTYQLGFIHEGWTVVTFTPTSVTLNYGTDTMEIRDVVSRPPGDPRSLHLIR
jgi:hypothetical protein